MAKKNNNPNGSDQFGYAKLSVPELNKVVADTVKEIGVLQDQKKEYVRGTNEVVKEKRKRVDAALSARNTAEVTAADNQHELAVGTFLKAAGQV